MCQLCVIGTFNSMHAGRGSWRRDLRRCLSGLAPASGTQRQFAICISPSLLITQSFFTSDLDSSLVGQQERALRVEVRGRATRVSAQRLSPRARPRPPFGLDFRIPLVFESGPRDWCLRLCVTIFACSEEPRTVRVALKCPKFHILSETAELRRQLAKSILWALGTRGRLRAPATVEHSV